MGARGALFSTARALVPPSKLRSENEKLSGGGKSSGLMSFLKIGDRAAGATGSGGTTRRAAKWWWSTSITLTSRPTSTEGEGGAEGRGARDRLQDLPEAAQGIMKACKIAADGDDCHDLVKNPALKRAIKDARRDLVPTLYPPHHPVRAPGLHRLGFQSTIPIGTSGLTVAGQNSTTRARQTSS